MCSFSISTSLLCCNIARNKHYPLVDSLFNTPVDLMGRFTLFVSSLTTLITWFSSHSPVNTEHTQRYGESEVQTIKRSTVMRVSLSRMRPINTKGMPLLPLLLGEMPARTCFCRFSLNLKKSKLCCFGFESDGSVFVTFSRQKCAGIELRRSKRMQ